MQRVVIHFFAATTVVGGLFVGGAGAAAGQPDVPGLPSGVSGVDANSLNNFTEIFNCLVNLGSCY